MDQIFHCWNFTLTLSSRPIHVPQGIFLQKRNVINLLLQTMSLMILRNELMFNPPPWEPKLKLGVKCKAITWLLKFTDQKVFPSALKKKAVSINRIGSSATMKGLEVRPRLVNNDAVIQHLHKFFNTDSGMNRSLDRNFDWNAGTTPIHPVELNVPFAQRARAIRRAPHTFASPN